MRWDELTDEVTQSLLPSLRDTNHIPNLVDKVTNCILTSFKIVVLLTLILLIFIICFYFCILHDNHAYANGFTKSNMACSGYENYKASLCVGILPTLLKGGSADSFSIKFELADYANKGGIFPNATYDISIIKKEYDTKLKDAAILSGTFNTRNGIWILYNNASGKQELAQAGKGWHLPESSPSNRADSINLTLPFKLKSGQYEVKSVVHVLKRQPLYFDSLLKVGDIESKDFLYSNKMNKITIISYYDKVSDFIFDANKRTISLKIPFDYNATRIDEGKVSVHEEVIIPNSFLELINTKNFSMTMDDNYFNSSLFKVDPYTYQDRTIIHYVPDTNTLFDISHNSSNVENRILKFVLFL